MDAPAAAEWVMLEETASADRWSGAELELDKHDPATWIGRGGYTAMHLAAQIGLPLALQWMPV